MFLKDEEEKNFWRDIYFECCRSKAADAAIILFKERVKNEDLEALKNIIEMQKTIIENNENELTNLYKKYEISKSNNKSLLQESDNYRSLPNVKIEFSEKEKKFTPHFIGRIE